MELDNNETKTLNEDYRLRPISIELIPIDLHTYGVNVYNLDPFVKDEKTMLMKTTAPAHALAAKYILKVLEEYANLSSRPSEIEDIAPSIKSSPTMGLII